MNRPGQISSTSHKMFACKYMLMILRKLAMKYCLTGLKRNIIKKGKFYKKKEIMSKKKKSFWTNLPALIGKITGLLVVIGTIIQMCQSPGVSIWSDDEPTSYSSTNDVTVISPREVIPSLTVINKGRDYWAKEGYYLEFDSLYKIWPIDIRSRADSAKVKITDNNNLN